MSTEANAGDGPVTDTRATVTKIWSEVLKRDTFDAEDDFFAIGGNSMTATLATYKLREEFEVEIPLMAIFETPTITGLAATIDDLIAAK